MVKCKKQFAVLTAVNIKAGSAKLCLMQRKQSPNVRKPWWRQPETKQHGSALSNAGTNTQSMSEVAKQSIAAVVCEIAAAFWALSKHICRLITSFDSIFN